MEAFVKYFLSANLLLLLQVVYYRLFLARQRRFVWNRIYILGGMLAALILPLVQFEIVPPSMPNPSFITILPEIVIGTSQPASPSVVAPAPAWTALELGLAVYGLGVAVSLGVLLMRNLFIINLIWKGEKTRLEGYTLVTASEDIGPASYFRYIFWNEGRGLDPQSAAVAMAHERCHSRQLHSIDLLAVEILKAFCWINPAIYMLRKDLRKTHEFLADQAALDVAGLDGIKRLLLMRQLGSRHLAIANHFHSHIKSRIMMLAQNSKRKAILHYVFIAPLAGLMAACTSLAHPLETASSYTAVDSPTTQASPVASAAETPGGFFNLEDLFVEAQMPLYGAAPQGEGLVCLGAQPPLMNLDTLRPQEVLEDEPRLLNRDRVIELIGYPQEAEAQKITGKVVVKVLVDETGHVIRYIFLKENHALLRDAVAAHVEDLRFLPGMKEGKAAKWWVVIPFSFGMGGC